VGIGAVLLYAIFLIPPVKRVVRNFAERYREFLFTVGFALFAAALMYFIVLPRI
jgi:Kef-type K+ transport system membrane component KefB